VNLYCSLILDFGLSYAETFPMTNSTKGYDVIISYDGSYTTYERTYPPARDPLINWSIDSPKAVEIAKNNPTIHEYLSKYRGAIIESMAIGGNQTCSAWTIEWTDQGFMDKPHNAKISIDANTGEVIYVETQMD